MCPKLCPEKLTSLGVGQCYLCQPQTAGVVVQSAVIIQDAWRPDQNNKQSPIVIILRSTEQVKVKGRHWPQCPCEVYGHKQTSQETSSSGNRERIFLTARTAGVSSVSAPEPRSSLWGRGRSKSGDRSSSCSSIPQSIHPSIHLLTLPSIHSFRHKTFHLSLIHPSIQKIHLSICLSIHPHLYLFIHLCVDSSNQPTFNPSV